MATAEQYGQWIIANQDKRGTPEFEKRAGAYKLARSGGSQKYADAKTHDGQPSRANSDGSYSTEVSITVTNPRLNGGAPTNIPSLWQGREVGEEEAVANALKSGNKYQSFPTIDQAVAAAQVRSNAGGASASSTAPASPAPYDPTQGMSTFDKLAAGTGKAMYDTARGIGQFIPEALGGISRADVEEARRLDEPLMNTTAGKVGNLVGNVAMLAPTAMIPGANTVRGAATIGALAGLVQPSTSTKETMTNFALGGAGGAGGQYIANKLPGFVGAWADSSKRKAATQMADSAQKFNIANRSNSLGYVIPPAELNPGATVELLSGLSGKIKTAQVASQRNQVVTNSLVRKALGITDDMPLDVDVLKTITEAAGETYGNVSSLGTVRPTAAYATALDDAIKPFTSSAQSFPGREVPSLVADIQSLKTAAFDAGHAINTIKVLRNQADTAYRAGDKLAGKAYKDAVDALESAIDAHMVSTGAPANLLKDYRAARQTIAKTYTAQKALNAETGNISAPKLAADLVRGKPLSGEMKDVARAATAFPKSMQMLKETPKAFSPLDFFVSGGSAFASGSPWPLLALGARPAARNMLLSKAAQKSALNPGFRQSLPSRVAQPLLDNRMVPLLGGPLGITGGIGAANLVQQY